jgi:hypothetical protein
MNSSTGSNASEIVAVFFFLALIAGAIIFAIFLWGTIFRKAGYSFWLSLLMFVPLANFIWLLIFAFSEWPIHRELNQLRAMTGRYPGRGFPVGQQPPLPPAQA